MTIFVAPSIRADSWLNEDRFSEFRQRYGYAALTTREVLSLAKCESGINSWRMMAQLTGVHFTTLWRWSAGRTEPQPRHIEALVEAFPELASYEPLWEGGHIHWLPPDSTKQTAE